MTDTSQSVHCMRCRTVRSLARFVGMSWRAEPSDSQMTMSARLSRATSPPTLMPYSRSRTIFIS